MEKIEYRTVGDGEKRALLKGRLTNLEQQHFQLRILYDVAYNAGLTSEVEKLDAQAHEIEGALGVVTAMLDELPQEDPDNPDPLLRTMPVLGDRRR